MTTENTAMKRTDTTPVEGAAQRIERKPVYMPATDVYERDDAIVVVADMPGVREQDVEIHLENDVLTIRGRSEPLRQDGFDVLYSEITDGDYERVFTLSNDIDRNGIKATMKNGVLRVVLPKAEQAKPRKITVQSE